MTVQPSNQTPELSIVVASGAGGEFLLRCLSSLRSQVERRHVEVLVPDRTGPKTIRRLRQDFPFTKAIPVELDHRPSVPELRRVGVNHSRAEIVAILEEHCIASPGWVDAIIETFQETDAAIGGPILDDEYKRRVDWAVYLSEYHNYLPPWEPGERYLLNGANIAYRRELLTRHTQVLDRGYWEVVLHPLLVREGLFRSVPSMGVHHTGPFEYRYYLKQRYLLSRVWGGSQRDQVSLAKRFFHLVGAPLFPAFLLFRIARRVNQSGLYTNKFLQALPALIPVVMAYTLGEWRGYLQGFGDALELVE